jgi:hypothetical protein
VGGWWSRVNLVNWLIIWFLRHFLVLSTSTTHRDVPQGASFGPVPPASLAKVPWLGEAVVVVVTKFGVCWVTPRAFESLVMWGPKPPLYQGPWTSEHIPRWWRRIHSRLIVNRALNTKESKKFNGEMCQVIYNSATDKREEEIILSFHASRYQ